MDSYFPTVNKPHNIAEVAIEVLNTSVVAAPPTVEKNDLQVVEIEQIINEVKTGNDSRHDYIPENAVNCNRQGLLLPSFEDEDFDFSIPPVRKPCHSVQRNLENTAGDVVSENDILTLDD